MSITAYVDPSSTPLVIGALGFTVLFAILMIVVVCGGMCTVCGIVTKKLNEKKGYKGGFAWGFFLGVIGIIVIVMKPDLNAQGAAPVPPPQKIGSVDLNK